MMPLDLHISLSAIIEDLCGESVLCPQSMATRNPIEKPVRASACSCVQVKMVTRAVRRAVTRRHRWRTILALSFASRVRNQHYYTLIRWIGRCTKTLVRIPPWWANVYFLSFFFCKCLRYLFSGCSVLVFGCSVLMNLSWNRTNFCFCPQLRIVGRMRYFLSYRSILRSRTLWWRRFSTVWGRVHVADLCLKW